MDFTLTFATLTLLLTIQSTFGLVVREEIYASELQAVPEVNQELNDVWSLYVGRFNKTYSDPSEALKRRMMWETTVALVKKHNDEADIGLHTYTMGLNQFSDMSFEEFRDVMLRGLDVSSMGGNEAPLNTSSASSSLPTTVDWRQHGLVTPVKDQGRCGSCWAFSTVGTIEGAHAKKTGELVSLSEQNLVDCSKGDHGCKGGWPYQSLGYVIANKGIDTERCYQYTGRDIGGCTYKTSCIGATISKRVMVAYGESSLQEAVASVGPISVAIAVTHNFMHYKSGIFTDSTCSSAHINHAVLAVGYGEGYWLVKNSWGALWGEHGYIKMARNKGNMCSIASAACYGVV